MARWRTHHNRKRAAIRRRQRAFWIFGKVERIKTPMWGDPDGDPVADVQWFFDAIRAFGE